MNLFILNENPVIAAQEQCDKHINKMVIESAQMLCTVHRDCRECANAFYMSSYA